MARKSFNPDLIPEPAKPRSNTGPSVPVTVTQLTAMVKRAIESVLPATVHVVGEISNFKRHSSGDGKGRKSCQEEFSSVRAIRQA